MEEIEKERERVMEKQEGKREWLTKETDYRLTKSRVEEERQTCLRNVTGRPLKQHVLLLI